MNVDQTQFRHAILDANLPVPDGLVGPNGAPAGRRFSVYRNNVAVSLTEALRTGFPVIRKLVGDQFFDAMAGVYLRAHPPKSPLMMHYGQDLPAFLAGFQPVAHLGYLADVARLELAMRASYHAADATPVDPAALQAMSPADLMDARFSLAPAVKLLSSEWPIHGLWAANIQGAANPAMAAEHVMITRTEFDPAPVLVTGAEMAFLRALGDGHPLGQAIEIAGEFDFAKLLGLLIGSNALTNINEGRQDT